jgi:MFS family permease
MLLKMSHIGKYSPYCGCNDWLLWLGRVFQGIATGAFTVNCLQLLTEMAPIELKLIIGIFYQLSVELGIITANLI